MDDNKVFQEVDIISVLKEIGSRNKVLNAKMLQELEKYVKDPDDFTQLRKFILDEQNSYTRSIVRLIFGDIVFMQFGSRM
jgi:hypothetical protein